MKTISLAMIIRDNEDCIKRCLDSVHGVFDEIVLVDTGSIDRTKEIVSNIEKVVLYDFEWIYDFAAARNYAFSKAKGDYIMWLDADEELLPEDREKLLNVIKILKTSNKYNCVEMINILDGSDLKFRRNRIIKKNTGKWVGYIHEYLETGRKPYKSDIVVHHFKQHNQTGRNLQIFEKHIENGEILTTRDMCYYGKELYWNGKYDKAIEVLTDFIGRKDAWFEDIIYCMNILSDIWKYKKDYTKAKQILLSEMLFAPPRAEALYRFANILSDEGKTSEAKIYYEIITNLEIPDTMGFLTLDDWTWKPWVALTQIYWHEGNKEKSLEAHNNAYKYNQTNSSILYNEKFFGYPNK